MKTFIACLFVVSILAFSAALFGEDLDPREELSSYVEALDLSDEQADQLKAVLSEQRTHRKEILAKHGFEQGAGKKQNRRALWAARGELKDLRSQTDEKLSEFLAPSQMKALAELRESAKSEMRQKLKDKRSDS